jgi:hypothetical protein
VLVIFVRQRPLLTQRPRHVPTPKPGAGFVRSTSVTRIDKTATRRGLHPNRPLTRAAFAAVSLAL